MRKPRPALDIVSDIGSKAFDLQHHSERDIALAVRLLRTVNAPMFDWLVRVLSVCPPDGIAIDRGSNDRKEND